MLSYLIYSCTWWKEECCCWHEHIEIVALCWLTNKGGHTQTTSSSLYLWHIRETTVKSWVRNQTPVLLKILDFSHFSGTVLKFESNFCYRTHRVQGHVVPVALNCPTVNTISNSTSMTRMIRICKAHIFLCGKKNELWPKACHPHIAGVSWAWSKRLPSGARSTSAFQSFNSTGRGWKCFHRIFH